MNKRLKSLDIVRGCAALSVFLTHLGRPKHHGSIEFIIFDTYYRLFSWLLDINHSIHPGVIIFIVLSGFCIHMKNAKHTISLDTSLGFHSNINKSLTSDTKSWLKKYFRRRFFRIYPVMIFAMILGIGALVITTGEKNISYCIGNFAGNAFLTTGVFPLFGKPIGNNPLISVIIECLLYIFYPIGLYLVYRKGWSKLFFLCCLIYITNISLLFLGLDTKWVSLNFYSFLLFWWIGAYAVDIAIKRDDSLTKYIKFRFTAILYISFCLISYLVSFKGAHFIEDILLSVVTAHFLCVIYCKPANDDSGKKFNWLSVFSIVGERSYSLFVIHIPILTILKYYFPSKNSNMIYLAIIFLSTELFYRFIEKPFHEMALRNSKKLLV